MERKDSGLYLLVLEVLRSHRRRIGSLGLHTLEEGTLIYVGSAKRGLGARAARHLRRRKKKHWHIDHLSTSPHIRPVDALCLPEPAMDEHQLNAQVGVLLRATAPFARFGASDCTQGCYAHLWFLRGQPEAVLAKLRRRFVRG